MYIIWCMDCWRFAVVDIKLNYIRSEAVIDYTLEQIF